MTFFTYLVASFFGILFGNFATSFIHRIPAGKPLLGNKTLKGTPPHCGACGVSLGVLEYMPLIGFIRSGGKCRSCGVSIPRIYPITELFGGIAALALAFFFGINYLFIIALLGVIVLYSTVVIFFML